MASAVSVSCARRYNARAAYLLVSENTASGSSRTRSRTCRRRSTGSTTASEDGHRWSGASGSRRDAAQAQAARATARSSGGQVREGDQSARRGLQLLDRGGLGADPVRHRGLHRARSHAGSAADHLATRVGVDRARPGGDCSGPRGRPVLSSMRRSKTST